MAQAGLNDKKNWGSKISLDCPFKLAQAESQIPLFVVGARPVAEGPRVQTLGLRGPSLQAALTHGPV